MNSNAFFCSVSGMWLILCMATAGQGQVTAVESEPDGVIQVERQQEPTSKIIQSTEDLHRETNTDNVPVVHRSGSDVTHKKSGLNLLQEKKIDKTPFVHGLPLPAPGEESRTTEAIARAISYGWQEYNQGNYGRAEQFFSRAVKSAEGDALWQAKTGLAFSLVQSGTTDKALPLLRELLKNGQQVESVGPMLAGLLLERGDLAELENVLQNLPPDQTSRWQKIIAEARFRQQVKILQKNGDVAGLLRLIDRSQELLAGCRYRESFFQAAVFLGTRADKSADSLLNALSRCAPQDMNWQERVMRQRLTMQSNLELIGSALAPAPSRLPASSWEKVVSQSLWQRIKKLQQKGPEYEGLVKALYALNPEDNQVASLAAWLCFQKGDYECAHRIFSAIISRQPSDDAFLGLAYTLQKMGDDVAALELTQRFPSGSNAKVRELQHNLYVSLGLRLYQEGEYQRAAQYLKQALELQPDDQENRKLLLWCRYQQGDVLPLAEFLFQQYQEQGSAAKARELAGILGRLADPAFSQRVINRFSMSADPEVRKLAGDFYFQHHHPVLAAQTYQGQSPYAGCAASELDSMFHFRSKGGDSGLSQLKASSLIVRQQYPTKGGKTWSLSIAPLFIYSGAVPADLPVGSAFLRKQGNEGQPDVWDDNLLVWQWQAGLQLEGDVDWDLRLGTTPLNGVVAPAVVGVIQAVGEDWQLKGSREPIRESLLSWVGQTDPYTDREWGRVVETALSGTKSFSFAHWWLSLEGGYGIYRGENVEQNSSLTAVVSIGQTTDWQGFERSLGLFVFGRGFKRNSDFYTFGHGGYYSPAQQIISGPFIRMTTKQESRYWLDFSLSVGLNYTDTDDASRYVELDALDLNLSEAARLDLGGIYSGDNDFGVGVDARIRGLVPLSGGWFVGGEAGVNNAADFTLWQVAFLLRYRFGKGMGLGLPEQRFSTLTDLVH